MLAMKEISGTKVTKRLLDYAKENKLQANMENGKPECQRKIIVADTRNRMQMDSL